MPVPEQRDLKVGRVQSLVQVGIEATQFKAARCIQSTRGNVVGLGFEHDPWKIAGARPCNRVPDKRGSELMLIRRAASFANAKGFSLMELRKLRDLAAKCEAELFRHETDEQ